MAGPSKLGADDFLPRLRELQKLSVVPTSPAEGRVLWAAHYLTMLRSLRELGREYNPMVWSERDFHDLAFDATRHFFIDAFHLMDWIVISYDDGVGRWGKGKRIDALFPRDDDATHYPKAPEGFDREIMGLVEQICNAHKHRSSRGKTAILRRPQKSGVSKNDHRPYVTVKASVWINEEYRPADGVACLAVGEWLEFIRRELPEEYDWCVAQAKANLRWPYTSYVGLDGDGPFSGRRQHPPASPPDG